MKSWNREVYGTKEAALAKILNKIHAIDLKEVGDILSKKEKEKRHSLMIDYSEILVGKQVEIAIASPSAKGM